MPKKSTSARGAQRGRAKNQKAFALVTSNVEEQELEEIASDEGVEEEAASTDVASPSTPPKASEESRASVSTRQAASSTVSKESSTVVPVTPRSGGRQRQRAAAQMITAEHFSYVRKDLITITILGSLMFAIIIVLYFALGSVI